MLPSKRLFPFCILLFAVVTARAASGQMNTASIAAGANHALALRSDGTVWSWGTNLVGQMGISNVTGSLFPLHVLSLSNTISIAAGSMHSLAVQSNGTVWAWGNNNGGALGNGTFANSTVPAQVTRITNAVAVSGGIGHSLALLTNGQVMAWGTNDQSQLGNGTTVNTNQPVFVSTLTNVVKVVAGGFHSVALTVSGEVWSWGLGADGEMGNGTTNNSSTPVKVPNFTNVVDIVAGKYFTLALKADGTVWGWGHNLNGELGIGNIVNTNVPTFALSGVKSIGAGFYTSAATLTNGQTVVWGYHVAAVSVPTPLLASPPPFTKFAIGYENPYPYSLGLTSDGQVWAWGINDEGLFGNGNITSPGIASYRFVPTFSFSATPARHWGKFSRGNLFDPIYCSMVVPLDLEQGIFVDRTGSDLYCYGGGTPWFLQTSNAPVFQADSITTGTNLSRFRVENPMMTFGSQGSGAPMYLNIPYTFGIYAGGFDENATGSTNVIKISVYDRTLFHGNTNIAPFNTFTIPLPRRTVNADSNAWINFLTAGGATTVETNGLRTTVAFLDSGDPTAKPMGLYWLNNSNSIPSFILTAYKITHTATGTNYFYKVEVLGSAQVGTNALAQMATNSAGAWAPLPLYTMDFEQQPLLRSVYVDRLYFQGHPMPPTYAGKSPAELNGLSMAVTNAVILTNSAYTNLDASPELRRHPQLDQFVLDMKKDPLALASYVINEIQLTDPYAAAESNQVVQAVINSGGVNRSALSTFREGQGSPVEQCALLVYLLRQAGYPAAYVFPTNGNISMLDTRISQLWRMQVQGVLNVLGVPYFTNSLITVNYPWVVTTIGTNTVHIFPWLKDTEIVEGVDLYDYMPTNYNTALKWCEDYVRGNTNILNLDPENLPARLFPKFAQQMLNTNAAGAVLSLDDVGVRAFDRRHQYPAWSYLPQPNFVTNMANVAVVGSLTDSTTTFPFLANIFDTARVEVYKDSVSGPNLLLTSGDWDACDFHDRKFLIFTNNARLNLWLAAYNTNTTVQAFAGPSSTAVQSNSVAIGTITNVIVQTIHQRRVVRLSQPTTVFPVSEVPGVTNQFSCVRGDVAAICLDFGRVTKAMLQPHADVYWAQVRQRATNNVFAPVVQDYQGTAAYLLGMGYWQKSDAFDALNQQWHKVHGLINFQPGLGIIGAATTGTNMQVRVDMAVHNEVLLANATLRPDTGVSISSGFDNYWTLSIVNGSAQEHDIVQHMFGDQSAISTVRLLQLAQARATNGNSPILELFAKNYASAGNQTYAGYGATVLKNHDTGMWTDVINLFAQVGSDYARVLMTPGLVTNSTQFYHGMGLLALGRQRQLAEISSPSATLNGGAGSLLPGFTPSGSSTSFPYDLFAASDGNFFFNYNNPGGLTTQPVFSDWNALFLNSGNNPYAFSPFQTTAGADAANLFNLSDPSTANAIHTGDDQGFFGTAWSWIENAYSTVADPVNVVSGDFYVDAVDLSIPGPFPLQLRRNYISRDLADNQFGYGWKQNFMPYLCLTTNAANQSIILAAELDGSVIAYHLTNGFWSVLRQDNPSLNNNSTAGIGTTANKFNNRLDLYTTNGNTYVITGADGSQRTYQQLSSFGLSSGTNQLNRNRPYLTRWQDHAGNYDLFFYGTNALADDYGQLTHIDSANGNSLVFKYDFFGRIVQAFTADGRFVQYDYDDYGDLITVTLPDFSQCQYQYEHYTFNTTNNGTVTANMDSDHLMIQEIKPNGRIVANAYDNLRRVTTQASTVGANLVLVTNAFFFYTNNVTGLTNQFATGSTRVEDVFHNPTIYYYTNNLITNTVDAFGNSAAQIWFPDGATNLTGYYPRSLQRTVDRRGLTNDFLYDAFGNVTQAVSRGDLTGEGILSQTATNIFTYTTNNLIATTTDPAGNGSRLIYGGSDPFLITTLVQSSSGTPVATNTFFYTNVTQLASSGLSTNFAFGLRWRNIRPGGATNDTMFDGRGFKAQEIRYPTTAGFPAISDPPVTTLFSFNARGQLYQEQTMGGGTVQMDYDPLDRLKSREVFDQNGQSVSREFYYYNRNGELEWYDGPRSNPEDYVNYHYDGAGRMIQQIRWRSQAKMDGTGVEAPAGYNLYSTTFQEFDGFGNLKRTIDARGVVTTNTWDALGRLVVRSILETNGNLLKSESFAYEPDGMVTSATNALGGVTQTLYNSLGKPRFQSNPDGSTNGWTYYLDGRPRREYQRNGAFLETTYDDVNRRATRIFYSAALVSLSTNVIGLDGRGNVVFKVDAAGNSFTNLVDGLDRLKVVAGPPILSVVSACGSTPPPCGIYVTNVLQQAVTNFYDSAGLVTTNVNALGEKTVTYFDVLGRVTRSEVRSGANVLVREISMAYSADHQSMTVTNGSGSGAIVTTTYTDNDGHPMLSIGYPSTGATEYDWLQSDLVGNLVSTAHVSSSNSAQTTWRTASFAFDGLNRPVSQTERDNAVTQFSYDAAGDLTNRAMPGNLTWSATYNNAGQILTETDKNGVQSTRSSSYAYYSSGNPWAGLLNTATDGSGVTRTNSYDDYLRVAAMNTTGPQNEQQMSCAWHYDARGLLTSIVQSFTSTNTGPTTTVQRQYDAYGQLTSENGQGQAWDAAGRRIQGSGMTFQYRADGLMSGMNGATFGFASSGLLTGRTNGSRTVTIDQRDGMGRPLQATTRNNLSAALTENWTWTGDGLPNTYIAGRDFTDKRSFTYGALHRRLTQETLNLGSGQSVTNSYAFDGGTAGGLGVLTAAVETGITNTWTSGLDGFSRVINETNSTVHRLAGGTVNGAATLRGYLNNQPIDLRYDAHIGGPWNAALSLQRGTNTLVVYADHPGQTSTNHSATYTVTSTAYENETSLYDGAGNVTNRVWKDSLGATVKTQTLIWDAFDRLVKVNERDVNGNGFNLGSVFDGLGRQVQTTETAVSNNVVMATNPMPTTVTFTYDPQVEFLIVGIGVSQGIASRQDSLTYGPDITGLYGGMQGVGGLESITSGPLNVTSIAINDGFGNVIAAVTNGAVAWNPARLNLYGPMDGYAPPRLSLTAPTYACLAWRSRPVNVANYAQLGTRPYDFARRAFLSADPLGHGSDPSLNTAFNGNPAMYFDPDGRYGKGFLSARNQEGYMPADASSTWTSGNYSGSVVRGASQGLFEGVDNIVNFVETTLFYRADAGGSPQDFVQSYPLASPMKNWFNVDYGDNASGNDFAATFGPLTQNAINSYGVGETTAETPMIEVPPPTYTPVETWQDYLPAAQDILNNTKNQYGNVDAYNMASPNGSGDAASPTAPNAYSVAFQMQLDPSQFGLSRAEQFQIANNALQTELAANPGLAQIVPQPAGWGRPPANWTWQHATIDQGRGQPGVMQLVPRQQHTSGSPFWPLLHPLPGGAGGYSQWAIPAGAPPNR